MRRFKIIFSALVISIVAWANSLGAQESQFLAKLKDLQNSGEKLYGIKELPREFDTLSGIKIM